MSRAAVSSCSPIISTRAWDDGRPDAFAAFENVGRAYLAFARDEPAYYSAMFEAGLSFDGDPALRQAADRSFASCAMPPEVLCARLPPGQRPPALMMALHIWALVARHRVAVLRAAMAADGDCR